MRCLLEVSPSRSTRDGSSSSPLCRPAPPICRRGSWANTRSSVLANTKTLARTRQAVSPSSRSSMLASSWLSLPPYKDGKAWIGLSVLPHTKHLACARQAEGPIPDPVSCPFRALSPCLWRPGSSGSLHPVADKIHHTYTPDREPDPSSALWLSLWLLSSSLYKVEWVFSAAAGAENLTQSTSKPGTFWLSKIVDFGSQIDDPIRATFSTAKPGGTWVSLRSIGTFDSICRIPDRL